MTHDMTSDSFQQMWYGIGIFTTPASAAVVTQMMKLSSNSFVDSDSLNPLRLEHALYHIINVSSAIWNVTVSQTNCIRGKAQVSPPTTPLAACVHRLPWTTLTNANAICRMSPELNCVHKTDRNWLTWQRPLRDRKTNFSMIIYSHSSTNPENLAKIVPGDFRDNWSERNH